MQIKYVYSHIANIFLVPSNFSSTNHHIFQFSLLYALFIQTHLEAKKYRKCNNLMAIKRENSIIAIAILEKSISHFGCTNIIFASCIYI